MVNDSPRPTADATAAANGGGVSSPQSQRRSFSPPWASVVRGDPEQKSSPTAAVAIPGSSSSPPSEGASAPDSFSVEISGSEAHPEISGANGGGNAGQQRSSVWKRPSNGVVEPASVMGGASSWPALGETTRPVPKLHSDNRRPVSDGSTSSLQAPIISQPPQRLANNTNNAHGNSTSHNPPTKQKSRNRNGGGGGSGGNFSGSGGPSHNNFNQPPPQTPPPFPVPHGMVPAVLDTSVRGARPASVGSPSHAGNEYSSPRNNNSRRSNFGSHRPRGDSRYNNNNNNYGGRRDQERGDVHHLPAPPQFLPPHIGFMGSPLPPGAVPLMGPPPLRIYPGGFDMAPHLYYVPAMPPESFRAMPLVPSPPPMLFPPAIENSLTSMIVKQIDFYFSDDNLVKDNYLRSNMDDQGWVPIGLIASFRRVQLLTQDIPVILESLRYSEVVEVQGDKLRRRDGWNKWLHSSARRNSDSSSTDAQSSSAPDNALTNSLQEISLENADCNVESQPESAEGGISNGKNVTNDETLV